MKNSLVSIIIVNWNGGEVFRNCLNSLKKTNYKNWELIVVDNGSTDDSELLPKKLNIKKHKLIKNKTNIGFAKANNQGYKIAKGDYILLLNNDTEVTTGFLATLVSKLEGESDLGVVQPKILLLAKPTHLDSVGSFLTKTGFLQHYGFLKKDSKMYSKEINIFSAKGACMLVKKEVIEKVGLFDDDYVSYFEETDFCWRVWLSGYKIRYVPKAKIYHKVGFTSKKKSQIEVNYHSMKNRLATLLKNLDTKNLIIITGVHLSILLTLSTYYALRLQTTKAQMIIKAIYWNIKNIKTTLNKRKQVSQIRNKSDEEIFKYILKSVNWREMLAHFVRSEKVFDDVHEV